jgi:hypothetical protein
MEAAHRNVPSRSTLERIGKRIGERIRGALPVIEPIVRETESVPAEACSISIGVDRTTVPIAELVDDKRQVRRRPYIRRPPPPVTVAYRMAYVATVAVHDADGETLVSKRFSATADEGPAALMEQLGGEVLHLRARPPSRVPRRRVLSRRKRMLKCWRCSIVRSSA